MNPRKNQPRSRKRDRKFGYSTKTSKRKAWNKGQKKNTTDNQHQEEPIPSTSSSKLQNYDYPVSNFEGYHLFNFELLCESVNKFTSCKQCSGELQLLEVSRVGLGANFIILCKNCGNSESFSNSAKVGPRGTSYEVNQRSILAMRMVGNGLAGLQTFCGVMDLPSPISDKPFKRSEEHILKAASISAKESMKTAVEEEIKCQITNQKLEEHQDSSDSNSESDLEESDEPKNIRVKGDGTWQKRGFQSLNGVVSVIGSETEKVIDLEVLSSYCKKCYEWQKKNGLPEGEQWRSWYGHHKSTCNKNYSGSSGGMESAGIISIFKRSVENYNVRYTEYIGDGDSKTFTNIVKVAPYGPNVTVSKLECVGHVGKRFGYHMRKLRTTMKGRKLSDGKGLFGRGRLTEAWIVKMQMYYAGVIRNNSTSLSNMIRSIWAIWYHISSTDDLPKHQFCPPGKNSWCKYRRAEADNTLAEFQHPRSLPKPVTEAIHPVFTQMTSVSILKRCLGGYTQNSNESFNSILWKLTPKSVFVGHSTVKLASNIAIVLFNDGMRGFLRLMESLQLHPGDNAIAAAKKKDKQRLYAARKQAEEDHKRSREVAKRLRLQEHEAAVQEDGNEYEAGAY